MKQFQFVFFSGFIGFTAPHIGEVRKEIIQRVEKDKAESVRHDIELQMIADKGDVPSILDSCYLYNDSFEMIHGSISGTKNYLKESWKYRMSRTHSLKNQRP